MWNRSLITAPSLEPLTVAEVKRQVRLGSSAGEPAPSAPTVALASPAAAGNVDDGVHQYRVTFVTADGETEGGTISDQVTVADKATNGQVELTAIPIGGAAVTSRKVYRTEAGGSTYKLLTTVADNTTTTYTDTTADSGLGASVTTTNDTEDPELSTMITAARMRCENATDRAMISQTWELHLDYFPPCGYVEFPLAPLQSVSSVTYTDTAGDSQTFAASNYVVHTPDGPNASRGRLALTRASVWPATYGDINDIQIQFVAGYGDAASDVPAILRQAMLMDATTLYESRTGRYGNWFFEKEPPTVARSIYWSFRSHATQRVA